MSRSPIIPDAGKGRAASHNNHPEPDQFAFDGEIPPPPILTAAGEITDAEGKSIADMAERWRKANGLTHEAFVERFKPYVHSSKGWWLIRNQAISDWEPGWNRLKATLRGLSTAIQDMDRASKNPLIDTPATQEFAKALLLLRTHRTAQRFVFILGPTGSGKTSTLDYAHHKLADGRNIIRLLGREAWKSPREFLADWGAALGIPKMAASVAGAQTQVRDALLSLGDAVLLMDEGHRMTGGEINMLIDWSNDLAKADNNAVHFVVAAMDTLWRKLSDSAKEEADQLRVNRCVGVVQLDPPGIEEISSLLDAGCRASSQLSAGDYTTLLPELANQARTSGSRAFIRDVRAHYAKQSALTLSKAREIAKSVAAKNHLRR